MKRGLATASIETKIRVSRAGGLATRQKGKMPLGVKFTSETGKVAANTRWSKKGKE